jgi:hypothetical protein
MAESGVAVTPSSHHKKTIFVELHPLPGSLDLTSQPRLGTENWILNWVLHQYQTSAVIALTNPLASA